MRRWRCSTLLFVVLALSGCAHVRTSAMLPLPMPLVTDGPARTVAIRVDRKTESRGIPGVSPPLAMWSDASFLAAIAEAAVRSRLFTRVVADGEADYTLGVTLLNFTQPAMGFNMTVTMAAEWTVLRREGDSLLGREFVPSSCHKSVGDAFAGATRLRLATECAARENIAEGLRRIDRLLDQR